MNKNTIIRPYKSTSSEIETRIEIVMKMTLQGFRKSDIVRYSAQNWKIKNRQIDNYIIKAKNEIQSIAATRKEEMTYLAVARFEDLYQKAYKNQDWGLCKCIQESINKLLGLNAYVGIKVAVTGSISPDKWLTENAD